MEVETYFSMFSGIGGFELAIKNITKNKIRCVGFSEIDKFAIQTYLKHFPDHINYKNAKEINTDELPDFDLLCGGFPCQAFSVAGKRRGFEDTRGTLFFDVARIIKSKKPKIILLENVKGLLNHEKGKTYRIILQTLDELGYNIEWMVLNSKNFGVPQNRERVFIIGYYGEECGQKIFPISGEGNKNSTFGKSTKSGGNHSGMTIIQINNPSHSNDRVYNSQGLSPTLNTMQGGARQPFVTIPVLTPDRLVKRQDGRRFKTDGEPMFTLNTQDRHGVYNGNQIRRLTPIECERLQGFPDNWTKGVSNSQRYKQLGNAVTVDVVEAIIKEIAYKHRYTKSDGERK